jgi:plastocyanin
MKVSITFFLLLTVFLASCAPRTHQVPIYIFYQCEPIEIEMEIFSFKPNHLAVLKNQSPIILHLRNTDDILHNFTLRAPDRNTILSQDLKSKESATANIGLPDSGNYVFYCFLHRHRRMVGGWKEC